LVISIPKTRCVSKYNFRLSFGYEIGFSQTCILTLILKICKRKIFFVSHIIYNRNSIIRLSSLAVTFFQNCYVLIVMCCKFFSSYFLGKFFLVKFEYNRNGNLLANPKYNPIFVLFRSIKSHFIFLTKM